MRRPLVRLAPVALIALVGLVALASCTSDGSGGTNGTNASGESPTSPGEPDRGSPSASGQPSANASPTPPAIPDPRPPVSGPTSDTCVDGWVTPSAERPRYTDPLGIIRRTTGVEGPLVVVDMRYFTGPESPPSDQGYLLVVERWYIKLYAEDDLSFQGRFIVEARHFGRGVAAVAPYDTERFRSPDWRAFQFDSAHTGRRAIPGLPGTWSGVQYDFVKGGRGLTIPGLPEAVAGCLSGT